MKYRHITTILLKKVSCILILCSCLLLSHCSQLLSTNKTTNESLHIDSESLAPAQQYAGEIFSYIIQVIVGKAGDPELQKDWSSRGLNKRLDLKSISEIMTGPYNNKQGILVFDPNILGLLEVLYYYDQNLNLYPDDPARNSFYPSPELVAMRLLLIQKIHNSQKINLESLFDRIELLTDQTTTPTQNDLSDINLCTEEIKLLQDIIAKRPRLLNYLKSPFLIDALNKIGVVQTDDFLIKAKAKANYKKINCKHFTGSYKSTAVKISFLPSMIKEFYYGNPQLGLSHYGFRPTPFYNQTIKKLKTDLLNATKRLFYNKLNTDKSLGGKISGEAWETLWKKVLQEKITFYLVDERPLVIYPDNAEQVIKDVCPEADFSIIILDKNVYRSIYFDKDKDIFPQVNRVYINIMDIKYSQSEELLDQVSLYIFSKIKNEILQLRSL